MKILKCDILYPFDFLKEKQLKHSSEISRMDLDEYMIWLHGLRMGFNDLFSRELSKSGDKIFELYYQDEIQYEKIVKEFKLKISFIELFSSKGFKWWRDISIGELKASFFNLNIRRTIQKRIQLRKFIDSFSPDLIFLREPCQIDNLFWKPYKRKIKIITMIGCDISHPINWQLQTSDTVFTITEEFNNFFNLNGVESHLFDYGFDKQILNEIAFGVKKYDVTFIGLLGTTEQLNKTNLLEYVSTKCNFMWWGPKGDLIKNYPGLLKSWQGIVAGIEMYQVYADSKIVLNDYVKSNGQNAVNLRFKEVLGVGTFLLTRHAENLAELESTNIFKTFLDKGDCVDKINYYLQNESERELIAVNAKKYVHNKFDYTQIIHQIRTKF